MPEPQPVIPIIKLESQRNSFYIRPIRRQVDPVALNEPPHRHNYQELIWIFAGAGSHKIDHHELAITPSTFFLIAQGQIHYFSQGVDLEGFVVRFTDDFLLDNIAEVSWDYRMTLFNHFAVHRSLAIKEKERPLYQRHLQRMWREQEEAAFGHMMVLRHLLGMLLIRLERTRRRMVPQDRAVSIEAKIYQSFLDLLDAHFKQETAVRFYARLLHITPRQLSTTVARFGGITAKQYIQNRRILEAKRYLQHTNASVKEIAFALNFNDPSYFSKVFKHNVGVSPQYYKANL